MNDAVKKWLIGFLLSVVGGGAVTLVALYIHYTIRNQVEAQMVLMGIPTPTVIQKIQSDIELQTTRIDQANSRLDEYGRTHESFDRKIQGVVDVLIRE